MPVRLRTTLLAVCLWASTGRTQTPAATATTVAVFLPGYGPGDWDSLRGSIIASDDGATTYTLFCVQQTPPSCVLDTDFPLNFAEGPNTLRFDGTKSGQITAHLSCDLAGSTAASCTGSSSYGDGFWEGPITGPTTTVWTKILTDSELKWGVLTLTTAPARPETTNIDDPTPVDSVTATAQTPSVTSSGAESSTSFGQGAGWSLLVSFIGAVVLI